MTVRRRSSAAISGGSGRCMLTSRLLDGSIAASSTNQGQTTIFRMPKKRGLSLFSTRGGSMRRWLIAAAAALVAAPAAAQQRVDFILNWVPGGDHAPYYYAKKLGWYQKEGIDLNLEPGKGSALATQKVGAGASSATTWASSRGATSASIPMATR